MLVAASDVGMKGCHYNAAVAPNTGERPSSEACKVPIVILASVMNQPPSQTLENRYVVTTCCLQ
jgi:hypothetical protein